MTKENSSSNSAAPQNIAYFSDGNILRDLGKLEGRIDGYVHELQECKNEIGKVRDSVSKLKEWKALVIGGAAVIACLASLITSILLK